MSASNRIEVLTYSLKQLSEIGLLNIHGPKVNRRSFYDDQEFTDRRLIDDYSSSWSDKIEIFRGVVDEEKINHEDFNKEMLNHLYYINDDEYDLDKFIDEHDI